jgi:hypothetical protein
MCRECAVPLRQSFHARQQASKRVTVMKKSLIATVISLLAAIGGTAYAQAPAPAPSTTAAAPISNDPIVNLRSAQRAANKQYSEQVSAAAKERDAKVKTAVISAVTEAKASGKNTRLAKREAKQKAQEDTKADYIAAVRAARVERNAALTEAKKTSKGK